jgi:hypothetical protein
MTQFVSAKPADFGSQKEKVDISLIGSIGTTIGQKLKPEGAADFHLKALMCKCSTILLDIA